MRSSSTRHTHFREGQTVWRLSDAGTADAAPHLMLNVTRIGSIANIVAGAWLMLSALFFRGIPLHAVNTLVVGALAVALALVALRRRPMFLAGNIALAAWLFVSTWTIPGGTALLSVNHVIVATLLFGFAAPVMAALDELEPRRRPSEAVTRRRPFVSRT